MQVAQRWNERTTCFHRRRDANGRRNGVVRALTEIHMVVRMHFQSGHFSGARRDHFVRVHVRGRARTGLENIDREMSVKLAVDHLLRRGDDGIGDGRIQQTKVFVHDGGGLLHITEGFDERATERNTADREILNGALGLGFVIGVLGDLDFSHRIFFDPVFCSHVSS